MRLDASGTLLFLGEPVQRTHAALRGAADAGWRCILASWRLAEAQDGVVRVAAALQVLAGGGTVDLPGHTEFVPALVAVLDRRAPALQRGRRLALHTAALWPHLPAAAIDVDLPGRPAAATSRTVGHGVVRFDPAGALLRLDGPTPLPAAAEADVAELRRQATTWIADLAGDWTITLDPLVHRTLAACLWRCDGASVHAVDALRGDPADDPADAAPLRAAVATWLACLRPRLQPPPAVVLPSADRLASAAGSAGDDDLQVDPSIFPVLFGTDPGIDTIHVPDAVFVHLDPALRLRGDGLRPADEDLLHRHLCRRRTLPSEATPALRPEGLERRAVEPGVGRACLVPDVELDDGPAYHDFTALGVGLTPYSEGGYVEIGRRIDGKASLLRALHRKACAERLEASGCRCGRVVAIARLPGDETIEMPDGHESPAALVVRAFRSAYRVKQLDPLVCCLHSLQHTPLVAAALAEAVQAVSTPPADATSALQADEALASALERQGASQESLRALLAPSLAMASTASSRLRAARLEAIDVWAPHLVRNAKARLALEWGTAPGGVSDATYLRWFAASVGSQLAAWRRLRFLHDYHHPGVSRWSPGHLYTLGENNVTLLAEFPDLDTGVFVDDDPAGLAGAIQLTAADVQVLRDRFATFHERDRTAAETVVRSLALLLAREEPGAAADAIDTVRSAYEDARRAARA